MNLTYDQLILLSVAAKFFLYKFREDSTPERNQKLMELIENIQKSAEKLKMSRFVENPDEIVLEDVKLFHWENMNESAYWCGITLNDGRYFHLNIHGDNLRVYLTDETPDEVSTGHRRKDLDVL